MSKRSAQALIKPLRALAWLKTGTNVTGYVGQIGDTTAQRLAVHVISEAAIVVNSWTK